MTWAKDELRAIAEADDLHVAPLRDDGAACGTPTWIWSVALDGAIDDLVDQAYREKHRGTPYLER